MLNHAYTKEELINIYKEYFEKDYPFIDEIAKPDRIGYLIMGGRYNLYLGYDEKEGSNFFFQVGPLSDNSNKFKLTEIKPEKLAYMLSDPWGRPNITYKNGTWSYTSSNVWEICLEALFLEDLFEYYNCIIRETVGKVLDSYPDY